MKEKSLFKTNIYLKNPVQRKRMFIRAVNTSTAIEGVHIVVSSKQKHTQTARFTKHPKQPS